MGQINNLNKSTLPETLQQVNAQGLSTPMNNAAVGRGGILVYNGGLITIENGGLKVTGTIEVIGRLLATGIVDFEGEVNITGPLDVSGLVTLMNDLNVASGGRIKAGSAEIHSDGSAVFGLFTIAANGDLTSEGALDIKGPTTLNNDLTVAAGKKIKLGGLTLENTGASGGQVNFPGGSITASTALGMLINHATVEIAANTLKFLDLPTTPLPANLRVDPSTGVVSRSTA